MEKVIAVLYVISVFWWIAGFYRVKKSEKDLNGCSFIFISVFTFMCYQCVAALIFKLVHIEVGNTAFSILNMIVGTLFWYLSQGKKMIQKYTYDVKDFIANFIFLLCVLRFGVAQFGYSLDMYNYQCLWDSSVHLRYARSMASEHEMVRMYFMSLNMGLWLESAYAFNPFNTGCTMFIHTDLAMLTITSGLFWALIRDRLHNKYLYVMGIIFTILYLAGYPLNNMVFGTSYLGAGNVCVIYLLCLTELYAHEKLDIKNYLIYLCLGIYGVVVSYMIFMPVIIGTIFIYLVMHLYKKGILTAKVIKKSVLILIPIIIFIGIYFYLYFWDSMSGLVEEGQIYRNFMTDFIFFVPFILLLMKKKNELATILLYVTCSYIGVFLIGVFAGKIAGYYYYKNYYMLWLVCFYGVIVVLEQLNEQRTFINAYLIGWGLLGLIWITDAEEHLQTYTNGLYGSVFGETTTNSVFSLYEFNKWGFTYEPVMPATRELFLEVAEMKKNISGNVFFVGNYTYAMQKQYAAIANQPEMDYFNAGSVEECIKLIKENCSYVCVTDAEYAPLDIREYVSSLNVIYSTDHGYIAEVR